MAQLNITKQTGDLFPAIEFNEIIDTINGKVDVEDVIDSLDSDSTTAPLSANQGRILNETLQQNLESLYAYGVEWDSGIADPTLTRIGNMELHKTLPIQSQYKGCVANGNVVNYWLNPNNWAYKANGFTPSVLDGTDGTVRVYIPKFYGKSGESGTKRWVKISSVKIDDTWMEIPEMLIDAYRCTVDTTNTSTPKTASVINTNAKFRGGTNNVDYDTYLSTDVFRTQLGKPRTNINITTARTYATNAGSELLCYEYYKWIFYWAWVIEYATFNSQATFNANLTENGYHQGGLGSGVTTFESANWAAYNATCPITPNGYCNEFGNFTGIKSLTIPTTVINGTTTVPTITFNVPRWRGFDNPFGDIYTRLAGIVLQRSVTNGDSVVYSTSDPTGFTETIGTKPIIGTETSVEGYTKKYDLGETGNIIPLVVGGSSTTYMCDYHYCNPTYLSLRILAVGGYSTSGTAAGLGFFFSGHAVGAASSSVGFRTLTRL